MPGEFEGDLSEAVFWGADMRRTRFRDVNLTGARISHSSVVDVGIDAFVDKLVVNGVDVTDYSRPSWKKSSGTTGTRSATSRCSSRRRNLLPGRRILRRRPSRGGGE
jgi:uncharacterized protein YjbI with pentapeptide repeats